MQLARVRTEQAGSAMRVYHSSVRLSGRNSGLLIGAAVVVLVLLAVGLVLITRRSPAQSSVDTARRADVMRVQLLPIPEGPITWPFERVIVPGHPSHPLAEIEAAIPDPLP